MSQLLSKVELFSRFWWPRTLYFMSISDIIISIAQSKITAQYRSWDQNDHNNQTFPTSRHWILLYKYFCCNPRKKRFSAIIRENRAWWHYFGLRGPTSNYYYILYCSLLAEARKQITTTDLMSALNDSNINKYIITMERTLRIKKIYLWIIWTIWTPNQHQ